MLMKSWKLYDEGDEYVELIAPLNHRLEDEIEEETVVEETKDIKDLKVFHRSIVKSVLLSDEVFKLCEETAYKELVNKICQEQLKSPMTNLEKQLWVYESKDNRLSVRYAISRMQAQEFHIPKFPVDTYKLYVINKVVYGEWEC